jgi:hypothetical protein
MHEENPNDAAKTEDTIDSTIKKAQSIEDIVQDNDKENNMAANSEDGPIIDDAANNEDAVDRRKYPRSEFTYPVEFKIFSQNFDHMPFNGYLKDISIGGACLQFDDRYGRFNIKDMENVKLKISFSIPTEDRISIFAQIRRIDKTDPKSFSVTLGIEFKDLESWQLDCIEKLIGMRNKDHNMMWNLWEQYNNWR